MSFQRPVFSGSIVVIATAAVLTGCVGAIEGEADQHGMTSAPSADRGSGSGSGGNGSSGAMGPPGAGAAPPIVPIVPTGGNPSQPGGSAPAACAAAAPGPAGLRRLSRREVGRTIAEVLGANAALADALPGTSINGFDNNTGTLNVDDGNLVYFKTLAEEVAKALLGDAGRRMAVLGCDPAGADRQNCLRAMITGLGRRLYRRPLVQAQIDELLAVAQKSASDPTTTGGAGPVLEAMLLSPYFLYRRELGAPDQATKGWNRLDGFELASRLSYFLWGGPPSDQLLATAAAGALNSADGVRTAATAMLADPRAAIGLQVLAEGWLRTESLREVDPDPIAFRGVWSEALRSSMAEETRRVLAQAAAGNSPVIDLLTSQTTFVDARVAALYGMPAVAGGTWTQASFTPAHRRSGILTHGSVLTGNASAGASPILRGKFVREALLCHVAPDPPPDVPDIKRITARSERDRLDKHRSVPACQGCHQLLDPIGFGLEVFDDIGRLRDKDSYGVPLTAQGEIVGAKGDGAFVGPDGLAARLRADPDTGRCVAANALRFALGRAEGAGDECALSALGAAAGKDGLSLRRLVVELAVSDNFRYVHP